MKLKKLSIATLICLLMAFTFTACSSSKSFTFRIENGESVKVTLDTTDGYNLLQEDGMITVQKDEEDVLNGIFLTSSGFDTYAAAITASDDAVILKATPDDSPTFYLYQFDGAAGMETTFLFQIQGSDTAVIIASLASQKEAEAAFDRLSFEVENVKHLK